MITPSHHTTAEPTPTTPLPIAFDTTDYTPSQGREAESIVQEIVEAMTLRLEEANKVFSPGALDEWRTGLLPQVKEQLKRSNWDNDRETVLAVAADMASIAALLAYEGEVDKDRVDAAFEACKFHRRCPARRPGASGTSLQAGCWCDCPLDL